jgi:undecaprenyl-diphosphatase
MTYLSAALLGLIQGLTEFLPVSSSGHLVITQSLLGFKEPPILFDVMVHGGTLVAVLVFFRKDILLIFQGIFTPSALKTDTPGARNQGRWFAILVIIGTIPAVVVGAVFRDFLESLFASAATVGFMLWVTALVLFMADRRVRRTKSVSEMSVLDAILIGIMQAIAIIPGISRSGFTISMGIFRKLTSDTAARFSFILSIPAIIGALILEILHAEALTTNQLGMYLVGTIVAMISGYFSIALLIRMVKNYRLKAFSIYLLLMGLIVIWAHIFAGKAT